MTPPDLQHDDPFVDHDASDMTTRSSKEWMKMPSEMGQNRSAPQPRTSSSTTSNGAPIVVHSSPLRDSVSTTGTIASHAARGDGADTPTPARKQRPLNHVNSQNTSNGRQRANHALPSNDPSTPTTARTGHALSRLFTSKGPIGQVCNFCGGAQHLGYCEIQALRMIQHKDNAGRPDWPTPLMDDEDECDCGHKTLIFQSERWQQHLRECPRSAGRYLDEKAWEYLGEELFTALEEAANYG